MPHQEEHDTPSLAETAEIMREAIIQLREVYIYCKLRLPPFEFSAIELALADKMITNLDYETSCKDGLTRIVKALYYIRPALQSGEVTRG
jgi:hypothetical protein